MLDNKLNSSFLKTKPEYIHKLNEMGIKTIRDLLLYFPRTYRDEQDFTTINEMRTDQVNVISGVVKSIFTSASRGGKSITRAVVGDASGEVPVIWFNQPHIKKMFFKGGQIILTGKLKFEQGRSIMLSPKYEKAATTLLHTGRIVPVYPESELITSKWLREKIYPLLKYCELFEEYLPEWILKTENLIPLKDAIYHIHFAKDEEFLKKAQERLAFDEVFLLQFLALKRKYTWRREAVGLKVAFEEARLNEFYSTLPFNLTGAQKRVINEILQDVTQPYPMMRLVQGDVGSGKTIVAAAAIHMIKCAGFQAAIMAPTEVLAKQHYRTLLPILNKFGVNVQLLTGSTPDKEKMEITRQLSTGTCDLVIGTHALIQENVSFANLGLAVVDEQHRFGVKQREVLKKHGTPHLLYLTATPIPRTMALTIYGDQDLSILDEMPPGRQEIITRIVPEQKRKDAYLWISEHIRKGRQIFVICPLVEDSDVIEAKAAIEEYENLRTEVFPQHRLALLHGRMKAEEKDSVMNSFKNGEVDILVSTSVVEVGIDVPNATIILIEGADRFGLSQLHQFRGRVGRGQHQSYCFLFSDSASEGTLQRLNAMVKYTSGFDLAEIDLSLRGPGEVYGIKQSGIPDLKMANFQNVDLLNRARQRAEELIQEDLGLTKYPLLRRIINNREELDFDYNV